MVTTIMDGGEKRCENRNRTGSVKAAIHIFGEKMMLESNSSSPSTRKPYQKINFLQKQPSKELRQSIIGLNENSREAESKAQADLELLKAKKTVKELAYQIEESSSRAKRNQNELQKLNDMSKSKVGPTLAGQEACKELELLKGELSRIRVDIELVKEETSRAIEEAEIYNGKKGSYLSTLESLRKEIEEANEEQVLVELAAIEAQKELVVVEAQKKDEKTKYSASMEEMRAKMDEMADELNFAEEIKEKLAAVELDINMLQTEMAPVKEMGQNVIETSGASLQELFLEWKLVTEEVEEGKKELASIKQAGFQIMAVMDIIRREKVMIVEQISRIKTCDEKADKMIKSLNSKLIRARNKLEMVNKGEETAKGILASLMTTLEKMNKDREAADEEQKLLMEETESVKLETQRIESETDSNNEKLQAKFQELEQIGLSELEALGKLKSITENVMRERESASKHKSTITISKFEYDYLCGCATAAQETADKKVEAAETWIAALKASEREARAKIETVNNKSSEQRLKEEQEIYQIDEALNAKQMAQGELQNQRDSWRKSTEADDAKTTPSRKVKIRRSITSPASKHMSPRPSSFTVKRRIKVMPVIAKYFASMNTERGSSFEEL